LIPINAGIVGASELMTPTDPVVVSGNAPTHAGMLLISQPGNKTAVWADPLVQGLLIEVNGVPTIDQNVLNLIAGLNIVLTPDALGGVTIATTTELDGTFDLDDGFILLGSSDFDFNDGDII